MRLVTFTIVEERPDEMVRLSDFRKPNLKLVFTMMVMGMWATSFITSIINPKYNPPEYVNPLIMLVGGYLFATANGDKVKEKNGGNGNGKNGDNKKD